MAEDHRGLWPCLPRAWSCRELFSWGYRPLLLMALPPDQAGPNPSYSHEAEMVGSSHLVDMITSELLPRPFGCHGRLVVGVHSLLGTSLRWGHTQHLRCHSLFPCGGFARSSRGVPT